MVARDDGIVIAKAGQKTLALLLARANRHGLIAGATGTGKTVTLQTLAEGFSAAGVPVFLADVKGDLAGLAMPGEAKPKLVERLAAMGLGPMRPAAAPVVLWDLLGAQGHPVRTTVSELGPMLLGRLLGLNEVQEGVLNLAFTVADEQGLLLLDLKDLRALLAHVSEHAPEYAQTHGNVSPASVGAIQRALLVLEQQGADKFLGEPALALEHLMLQDGQGRGGISILAADKLMASPRLYAMFLLWLLSELFEQLPEVGDLDRPKLVFFFDEAHLLFDDAPPALVDKVEQVVRLVRSKGVGIFFVTQNPLDIPETILGQLGNRVQHALRAFTPRDQKAVRAAAETFRANPKLKTEAVIGELAVGEALVSLLDADGTPAMVERALIRPPVSRLGPLKPEERQQVIAASPVAGLYDQAVDRESAFEMLRAQAAAPEPTSTGGAWSSPWGKAIGAVLGGGAADPAPTTVSSGAGGWSSRGGFAQRRGPPARQQQGLAGAIAGTVAKQVARSVASQIGTQIGRQIVRGILGGILK